MATLHVESTRTLKGGILGVPQSTILMTLRVVAPSTQSIKHARHILASQLPQWISPVGDAAALSTHQAVTLFAELILGLQLQAGIAISRRFHLSRAPNQVQSQRGELLELALPITLHTATKLAGQWALAALNALFSNDRKVKRLSIDPILKRMPTMPGAGINRFFILRAADELQIPFHSAVGGLIVLGTGAKSRWLQSLSSDRTPSIGVVLAKDKQLTAQMLRQAGLPGAVNSIARTASHAIEIANSLGYPVVVKPADSDRGQGVAADLRSSEDVAIAFEEALKISPKVLVEKWFAGYTHRLTVQDGIVIRVVKRVAGGVVGDGTNNVSRLIEEYQKTPQQQRMTRQLGRPPLALDREAIALLAQEGYSPDYIPKLGEYVKLRRRDNVNAGATNVEMYPTDELLVHPDNIRLAVAAASILRLDFAGIDLIISDISQSWLEVGALICEINSTPQMGGWKDDQLYQRVLIRLFEGVACIPAELKIVGAHAQRRDAICESILRSRPHVCVSAANGIWINGHLAATHFQDSFDAALGLLQRREAQRAVCLMSVQDVYSHGLPMPHWDSVHIDEEQFLTSDEKSQLSAIAHCPQLMPSKL